ncbi:MAG: hypothetical protein JSW53_06330 [Candidatus Bathyarchaeota archaeon]|nr:MAG: hypothetical protein JSW53_06330 [Candidatus Bathyarchaeota archaeon]
MSNLEVIRSLKRDLIRMRKEIEAMDGREKKEAWKAYAELLTSLEVGRRDSLPRPSHPFRKSP